ncbi:MAG: M15 family metallopeptidase [Gammaproteobacteria bacterium]|nr:M15 family metallopeptidase [Gammaproteobacteria bacterium]
MSKHDIVLIADPRVLSIPVKENHDPLIDLKDQSIIKIGPSPEIPNNTDYTKMRKTVYEKLLHAQELLEAGMFFCLYECYRSLSLQKMLYDHRYKIIKSLHPDWTHQQTFIETTKMVSPVINLDGSKNVPPHSTGAAIDVYLIDVNGDALDMGIHPKDWIEDTDDSISFTDSNKISSEAKQNRKIMTNALSQVGFVNYPTEYWHWSYGDRYWAYNMKQSQAIYDTISEHKQEVALEIS